ncbi:RNA polymerase sigma factor [Methylorubrum thiocyanatum]|jgi:RNA polymerase sigma-70 factor (ECF subfamily)|uniref:RNA polymerase sigma factor n=1 Tax=Methylorubrum thiocyanatum TaxID=47958 RepID=UPI00383BB3D6
MSINTAGLPPTADLDDLFRRYHRELRACAYKRLNDHDAAADVVQDAFMRCLAPETLSVAVQPRFFLRRIVENLAIDVVRSRQRRSGDVQIDDLADSLVDPYPSAERWVVARQDYARLKQILDVLSPATREALLLSRVEGLTHPEIARHLGISTSMVARHIMNAMAHCLLRYARQGR